ncbi:MAG: TOBE domain-containing protein, partial [Dehalococcoidia bacterium]|nr:TOBE domain-containing protein [Dehalococcoidia bacterium]
ADFMGASNIFSGKVRGKDGKKVQLETEAGLRIIATRSKGKRGEEITGISVHPELIEVSPEGAGLEGDNKFRGKVAEMIYQGDFIEMKIALGQTGEQITANLSSRLDQKSQFSPGEEVLVHWNPESSNILLG